MLVMKMNKNSFTTMVSFEKMIRNEQKSDRPILNDNVE